MLLLKMYMYLVLFMQLSMFSLYFKSTFFFKILINFCCYNLRMKNFKSAFSFYCTMSTDIIVIVKAEALP